MTVKFKTTYTPALMDAGLSRDQAYLYQLLLENGSMLAGRIPRFMDISRPQAYKLLQELVDLGVVSKNQSPGTPARYMPTHPFAVQELLRQQREKLELSANTVQSVMGSLISEFTKSSKLPGVRIISGIEGLVELYKDILLEKENICLIRSARDDDKPELLSIVLNQIKKQVELGINVRIIGPLPTDVSIEELLIRDESRLTKRRVLPREKFSLPAQILIYRNKVVITAYETTMITTIIENEAIATTLRAVFEVVWQTAEEPNHQQIP